jgi:DNA-binding transcriptional LysR family regulator
VDLHYLKVFHAVATLESFTKASAQMHISQSSLSTEIRKFEDALGLKLFNRVSNRISLNENGKVLYEYSCKIFDLVTQAEYKLLNHRDYMTGTLEIGASNTPGTYIFPDVIAEYKKLYPGVNINLNIAITSEIAHYIHIGALDFAVNGGSMSYHKEITVEKLHEDRLLLVASPRSAYAGIKRVGVAEIERMPFVLHKNDSQLYTYYKSFIELYGIPENVSITLGNIDAIKHALMAGIGVSLIPYVSVRHELHTGLLVSLPLEAGIDEPPYPYSLIYHANRYLSPPAERFIELLRMYTRSMPCSGGKD